MKTDASLFADGFRPSLPYLRRTLVTAAGFQGLGIHARAGILIRLRLREMGFRRYTNFIASWNKAPLRTMALLRVPPAAGFSLRT